MPKKTHATSCVLRLFDVAFSWGLDILRGSFVKKYGLKGREWARTRVDRYDRKVNYGKGL